MRSSRLAIRRDVLSEGGRVYGLDEFQAVIQGLKTSNDASILTRFPISTDAIEPLMQYPPCRGGRYMTSSQLLDLAMCQRLEGYRVIRFVVMKLQGALDQLHLGPVMRNLTWASLCFLASGRSSDFALISGGDIARSN